MNSCEEAYFHLLVCGDQARDGGYDPQPNQYEPDGVPCEDLCTKPIDDDDDKGFNTTYKATANSCLTN